MNLLMDPIPNKSPFEEILVATRTDRFETIPATAWVSRMNQQPRLHKWGLSAEVSPTPSTLLGQNGKPGTGPGHQTPKQTFSIDAWMGTFNTGPGWRRAPRIQMEPGLHRDPPTKGRIQNSFPARCRSPSPS